MLEADQVYSKAGARIALRPVKFQRVSALTLFIYENQGGEDGYTSLSELNIYGLTLDGLDVASIHSKKKK